MLRDPLAGKHLHQHLHASFPGAGVARFGELRSPVAAGESPSADTTGPPGFRAYHIPADISGLATSLGDATDDHIVDQIRVRAVSLNER
jgi:hypothetical protein